MDGNGVFGLACWYVQLWEWMKLKNCRRVGTSVSSAIVLCNCGPHTWFWRPSVIASLGVPAQQLKEPGRKWYVQRTKSSWSLALRYHIQEKLTPQQTLQTNDPLIAQTSGYLFPFYWDSGKANSLQIFRYNFPFECLVNWPTPDNKNDDFLIFPTFPSINWHTKGHQVVFLFGGLPGPFFWNILCPNLQKRKTKRSPVFQTSKQLPPLFGPNLRHLEPGGMQLLLAFSICFVYKPS